MKRILVVGQTPPPYGGQAVMIQHLIDWQYKNIEIFHVRMAFSRGMKDLGKFQFYKVYHLLSIVLKIYYYRLFKKVDILYYPPSGPNSAVIRDMLILFTTRWMFRKTIFHFHASGLSEHLKHSNKFFLYVFKKCFFYPDVSIRLSESCPNEGALIQSKVNVIIPNGLPDEALTPNKQTEKKELNILFIGLLEESKGELDLCRSLKILKDKGINCKLRVAGEFKSIEYREKFFAFLKDNDLSDNVIYLGIIKGEQKKLAFRESDVFGFPSYFHSESFPLVLIEAMSYGLPIISTKWRGIVDMVEDGINGYLVDIKSPYVLAEKFKLLFENVGLRQELGRNARDLFIKNYEIHRHLQLMENLFENV